MKNITLLAVALLAQVSFAQDSCAEAFPISGAGQFSVGAINGAQITQDCVFGGATSLSAEWYAYTPSENFTVTVTADLTPNIGKDTRVHVYMGSCGSLTCVDGDDDAGVLGNPSYLSVVTFDALAGNTYYIAWDNSYPSGNNFVFDLIENEYIPPPPTPITYTSQSISTINSNYNLCIVDMNNDHLDDIVGVSNNQLKVHYQNADDTFTVSTMTVPGTSYMPTWSMAAGDFNKDGYNDLVLGSGSGLSLWKSNATGTAYTSVTPNQSIFCQRTNFADINNDGHLDIFSCHDVDANVYFLNDGTNGLLTYQVGNTPGAYNLGGITGNYASIWSDFDNDGDSDLFISKCSGPACELHRNDGDGVFTNIGVLTGINITPIDTWSTAVGDFDNDADMDVIIGSNGWVKTIFMRNNLEGQVITDSFTNITAGSGWENDETNNQDYVAYDFDNDGYLDVMSAGGRIMFNVKDDKFAPVAYTGLSMGAIGDLNNDGFLDFLNGNTIKYAVPNGNNWLKVALNGTESNKNGIGARILIEGAFGKKIRDVRAGDGFRYMSSHTAHFGIGDFDAIESVTIIWPSGTVDTFTDVTINSQMVVTEGQTLGTGNPFHDGFSMYPNPTADELHFTMKGGVQIAAAIVRDLAGRIVIPRTAVQGDKLDVRSLSPSAYIVTLESTDGQKVSRRFIRK